MIRGPVLALGVVGPEVRRLQRLLVMMKLLDYAGIDGVFGPVTEGAVKWFQEGEGLVVDGVVGAATWAKLPVDPDTPLLQAGSAGSVVSALQRWLRESAAANGTPDPGAADGVFGPLTQTSVKAYQYGRGVAVDGVVGDQTWWVPAGAAGATLASLAGLTTV